MLEAWHERLWECRHGPIHSYSVCLKDWDERVWQHAWVNRIGLFLRQWSIHLAGITNVPQLGPLPSPVIHMTHDVDALHKTFPIRIKQTAFNIYNAFSAVRVGNLPLAFQRFRQTVRFFCSNEDCVFDRLLQAEKSAKSWLPGIFILK